MKLWTQDGHFYRNATSWVIQAPSTMQPPTTHPQFLVFDLWAPIGACPDQCGNSESLHLLLFIIDLFLTTSSVGFKTENQQQPVTVRESWSCYKFITRRPYNTDQEHFSARTYLWMYRRLSKSAVCTWCCCRSALYTESKGACSDYQTLWSCQSYCGRWNNQPNWCRSSYILAEADSATLWHLGYERPAEAAQLAFTFKSSQV